MSNTLHEYDKIVAKSIEKILSLVIKQNKIAFGKFDRKNPEHLYLFNILSIINNIYKDKISICINTSFLNYIIFKKYKFVKFSYKYNIKIDDFINNLKKELKIDKELKSIYYIYYMRET